jgi:hypothetical protein
MYMYAKGIDFTSFYDFSVVFWNYFDSVGFFVFYLFFFFFGGGGLLKNCSQTFYIVFLLVNSSISVYDNQQSFVILVSR